MSNVIESLGRWYNGITLGFDPKNRSSILLRLIENKGEQNFIMIQAGSNPGRPVWKERTPTLRITGHAELDSL